MQPSVDLQQHFVSFRMAHSFQKISEDAPFRQGDILCPCHETATFAGLPHGSVAVIITADCDIANDKFGDFLSYLPIVPVEAYLNSFWSRSKLERIVSDACQIVTEHIYRAELKTNREIHRLKESELLEWISERGTSAIISSYEFESSKRKFIEKQFELISTAIENGQNENLAKLMRCWKLKEIDTSQQAIEIKKGVAEITKALSFFLVPEMPESMRFGHVITMRDVRSIHADDVYVSRRALPHHRQDDQCMHRIGRFSDQMRFAIAQRFGSLFSRIGLSEEFEADCRTLPDLVVASLIPTIADESQND